MEHLWHRMKGIGYNSTVHRFTLFEGRKMRTQGLKFFFALLCFWALTGMQCSEQHAPPSLNTAHLKDIHLQISDPATGAPAVYIGWEKLSDPKVSYYEVYQSFNKDSLVHSSLTQLASDSPHVVILLPDSSQPMTVYYAVRAVAVEATGQKVISDTLAIDSITVLPSFSIHNPGQKSVQVGRDLTIELDVSSNQGILLKAVLYERNNGDWSIKQQFCLPRDNCNNPVFGTSYQPETLTLEKVAAGDTVASLLCVQGIESFEARLTGLNQSLICSRFSRVAK